MTDMLELAMQRVKARYGYDPEVQAIVAEYERRGCTDPTLTAGEAIHAFCAWLTMRAEPLTISGQRASSPLMQLANAFCAANDLAEPPPNWYVDRLRLPASYSLQRGGWPDADLSKYIMRLDNENHTLDGRP